MSTAKAPTAAIEFIGVDKRFGVPARLPTSWPHAM